MAPVTRSLSYDSVLSLSMEYVRPQLVDNIFTSSALLAALYGAYGKKASQKKGVRLVNGGERIRVPLLYGENSTVKSYEGYDELDVTPQEGITAAFQTWRQLAGSVAISRREERQNAGKQKIRDLLEAKIMQLDMSMRQELNYQLIGKNVSSAVWSAGSGLSTSGSDFDPLLHFVCKDPSGSVSVSEINQSTYSWWRNHSIDGSAAHGSKDSGALRGYLCDDWATLVQAARFCYNACSRGEGGAPDLGILDQLCYESYEAALDNKMRYTNSKGPASAGFDSVRFKGQDLVWDEMMPDVDGGYVYTSSSWSTSTWMMLNLDYIELVIDSETDFITTPFVRPENQDAKVSQVLVMGNLCCSNRRKQGLIYGITAGIAA